MPHRSPSRRGKGTPVRPNAPARDGREYVSTLTGLSDVTGSLQALGDAILPLHFLSILLPPNAHAWVTSHKLRTTLLALSAVTVAVLLQLTVTRVEVDHATVLATLNETVAVQPAVEVQVQPSAVEVEPTAVQVPVAPPPPPSLQVEPTHVQVAAPPVEVVDSNLLPPVPDSTLVSSCVITAGNLTSRSSRASSGSLDLFLAVPTRGERCVAGVLVQFKSITPDASHSKLCLSIVALSHNAELQLRSTGSLSRCLTPAGTVAYDRSLRQALGRGGEEDIPPPAFLLDGLVSGEYSLAVHVADVERVSYKAAMRVRVDNPHDGGVDTLPELTLKAASAA